MSLQKINQIKSKGSKNEPYNRIEGQFAKDLVTLAKNWFEFLGWLFILTPITYIAINYDFLKVSNKQFEQLARQQTSNQFIINSLIVTFKIGSIFFKIISLMSAVLIAGYLWVKFTENNFYKSFFQKYVKNKIMRVFIDLLTFLIFIALLEIFLTYAIVTISTLVKNSP